MFKYIVHITKLSLWGFMYWATSPFFSIINGANTLFRAPILDWETCRWFEWLAGYERSSGTQPCFCLSSSARHGITIQETQPATSFVNVYLFVWCATVHICAPCSLCSVASDWFWRVESWWSAGPSQEARDHGAAAAFTFSSFLSLCALANLSPPSSYTSPTFQSNFFLGYGHPPPLTGFLICNSDIYCRPKWDAVLQVVGGDSDVGQ